MFEILYKYNLKFNFEIIYFVNSNEDNAFKNNLEKCFKNTIKIACLNEIIKENNYAFNLDCLLVEPIDYKFSILKKNLLSDILFIQTSNKNKSTFLNITFFIILYKI